MLMRKSHSNSAFGGRQVPNIKYKPTTRIAPPETFAKAFDRHVTDLLDIYKVGIASVCAC